MSRAWGACWPCDHRPHFRQAGNHLRNLLNRSDAAPYDIANMIVVTIVVRRRLGAKSAAMLGRFSVPAVFLCCQIGDSGRNGRMRMRGLPG